MIRVKIHHKWRWSVTIYGSTQDQLYSCMTQKEVLEFIKKNFKLLGEGNQIVITRGRK